MPTETEQRVYGLLHRMSSDGLPALKRLFWTELNYDRANVPLSTRDWSQRARDALEGPPVILARHESRFGSFDIIYARLSPEQRGRHFPLSLTAERLVVSQLLKDHPYALFVFSDAEARHWHFVNVRYDKGIARRRVFRRIAVGPHERLRTAAERVAMLDLATLGPDLSGLSPLAIQQRHDEAFDVEAVTQEFFYRFARLFYRVRDEIAAVPDLAADADGHAQMFLDRLLFLYFIQKKGWLNQDPDYLYNRFLDGHVDRPESTGFYSDVVYLLFLALSDRETNRSLADRLGAVPFLNGGLFELPLSSRGVAAAQARLPVTNRTFRALFDDLLERFNFTVSEDTPLDQEVAIDPEMLGKIFESLVLEREQDPEVDLRKATGSYYTPRSVVAFMCREALAEYLAAESGIERERIEALLDLPPADRLTDEERALLAGADGRPPLLSPAEAQALKSLLLEVRACDPAVGSGAFLVGLLQAITSAVGLLDWYLHGDETINRRNYAYDLKKRVIERCLYGVDIQAQAVQICELRLWLSLVVDYELPEGMDFAEAIRQIPALPNLAYKVCQGDSLLERLFNRVVQLDVVHDQEAREIVENLQREKAAYFSLADTSEKRSRERRILELQIALAGKLVEEKRKRLLGYQPPLFGEESAGERREREAWEARVREYTELKARVEQARKRLAQLRRHSRTEGLSADVLRRRLLGDPDHPTFLWRVDFAEVFLEKGGFDLMIANPPYVRQERIKHLKADLRRVFPEVYHGMADIYVYFYAQGLRQLRDGGVLVYISSNKFMRAGYGKTLRRLLGQQVTLRTVIDFGDLPIFEATTYPTVLVMRKRAPADDHAFRALTVDGIEAVHRLPDVVRERAWMQPQAILRPEGWSLVRREVSRLLEKLRAAGKPLGEYVEGRLYYGIKTGLNKAFVIDQATRDRLVAQDPHSAEIIKPWLRGRDVKRWRVEWGYKYLIAIQNSGDEDADNPWADAETEAEAEEIFRRTYPAIYEHLNRYEARLRRRADQGRFWWELRPCEYYAEFEKPKVIIPAIARAASYAFDRDGFYSNDKTTIIPTNDLYLLGLLNSWTLDFVMHSISAGRRGGYFEYKPMYLALLPIPQPTSAQRAAIEDLVCKLLGARGEGPEAAEWERELNRLVYEVYELTEEEIAIVEEARHG